MNTPPYDTDYNNFSTDLADIDTTAIESENEIYERLSATTESFNEIYERLCATE